MDARYNQVSWESLTKLMDIKRLACKSIGIEVEMHSKETNNRLNCRVFLGLIIALVTWSSLIEFYRKSFNGQATWYTNHWLKHFSLQNTQKNLVEDETSGPRVQFLDTFRMLMVLTVLIQHGFTMYSIGRMMFLVGELTVAFVSFPSK